MTEVEATVESLWLARKDADWWIHKLYGFAGDLGATVIRTSISRTERKCCVGAFPLLFFYF